MLTASVAIIAQCIIYSGGSMANWETEYKKASLGRRIAVLRTLRGDAQFTFADRVGISQPMLSRIETDSAPPSVAILTRICAIFGVTLDELVPATIGAPDVDSTYRTERSAA